MEVNQDLQRYGRLPDQRATLRTSHDLKRRGDREKEGRHKRVQVRCESPWIQGKGQSPPLSRRSGTESVPISSRDAWDSAGTGW